MDSPLHYYTSWSQYQQGALPINLTITTLMVPISLILDV